MALPLPDPSPPFSFPLDRPLSSSPRPLSLPSSDLRSLPHLAIRSNRLLPLSHLISPTRLSLGISASSTSGASSSHGDDDKVDYLASLLFSLSQRTGQFLESSWLQTVKFLQSHDFRQMIQQSLLTANQKLEQFGYNARKGAERFDRHFKVSERAQEMADFAKQQVKNVDEQYRLVQKFRNASTDFRRTWPTYMRQLNRFLRTPLGRVISTVAFLWFLLSGWLFRIVLFSVWVLPLAAPLLINSAARGMIVEGQCPLCKRRFIGNRNQMVVCNYCKAVVWQPRQDFSKGESDPTIIDIDIE